MRQLGRANLERDARYLRPLLGPLWMIVDDDDNLNLNPVGPVVRLGEANGAAVELRRILDYNSDGTPYTDAGGDQQVRYGLFLVGQNGVPQVSLLSGTQASPNLASLHVNQQGVRAGVPEIPFTVEQRVGMTNEGGLAICVVAGENLVRGNVVYVKIASGADGKVYKTIHTDGESIQMPVGFVYADADADSYVWVVTNGIAYALPESGITAARGNVVIVSNAETGRVEQAATTPTTEHWRECGHWLDTGSGNGALARLIIHFN